MRLVSLSLRNFRQHARTDIEFHPGLTGIIGPNGAGKSTILEAIAWAVYGSAAARGTNDTLRFARAPQGARVEVELQFELGGHHYRVARTLTRAEVFLDGGAAPVAVTLGGATAFLQSRIGMTREEFFNTYFTGQKELAFLAAMGPADRGRFLSQVLGYERLRRAQEQARARRGELRTEIRALRGALADPEALDADRRAAEQRVGEVLAALRAAEREAEEARAALAEVAPRWEAAQAARDRHRELTHALQDATRERESAEGERARLERELEAVAAAEQELAPLRAPLAGLPAAQAEVEGHAALARHHERRLALAEQVAALDEDLASGAERLEKLAQAPELEARYAAELQEVRGEREALERELDEARTTWVRDRQDAETRLQGLRTQAEELKEQITGLEELGPEGACPTCGRPMGKDYPRLLEQLREQWVTLVQDGKWWASRFEQLKPRPEELTAREQRLQELARQVEEKGQKYARCQAALQEREGLLREHGARQTRRAERARELEEIPAGYDPAEHADAESRLRELRQVERAAARLEEAVRRREEYELGRAAAGERVAAAAERVQAAGAERDSLGFSEEVFGAARAAFTEADGRARTLELRLAELRGEVHTAEHALQAARRAEAEYRERARQVEAHEAELHLHEELDEAYTELRQELNDQVRPELGEIASAFLAQLTDGRYTAMEINDSYDILVLDEGEEKPVISGGEEDVANLVLRLSLSQMIAERAGHPLSLLVLDEVFGSLDVARRDNVIQLLHALEDRFEQVILITHIDGIREGLDRVLRVEYDERSASAVVREDSFDGDPASEAPLAAD